jgi:hypothetical protein
MVPESFERFFLATTGVGGVFVGLLFIAISIAPRRTFDPGADTGAQQQRLAKATLLTLLNGFLVSCVAIVPSINVGWISLVLDRLACSSPPSSSGCWPVPIGTRSRGSAPDFIGRASPV